MRARESLGEARGLEEKRKRERKKRMQDRRREGGLEDKIEWEKQEVTRRTREKGEPGKV